MTVLSLNEFTALEHPIKKVKALEIKAILALFQMPYCV